MNPAPPAATNPPAPTAPTTPMPSATPIPTPAPTAPPIIVDPPAAGVPVGFDQTLNVSQVLGTITAVVANPSLLDVRVDQDARKVILTGKAIGSTTLTVTDQRGLSAIVPIRVAYNAGSIADSVSLQLTGNPASVQFIREQAAAIATKSATARVNAAIVAPPDDLHVNGPLQQDDLATVDVPVLIQGNDYFPVSGTTHVLVENRAAPRISPTSLLVSDYPERLTENGVLFTATLERAEPRRFLYFHYNPAGQPDRRIVLRAQNDSAEPALLQFIAGPGGPNPNEMRVGHDSTALFLVHLVQNEGRIITIPAHTTINLIEQDMPPKTIVSNLLQLRVLDGGQIHLTLFAQDAAESPTAPVSEAMLLSSTVKHARGIYTIPEFHYEQLWNLTNPYLELSIGQIPLPNLLKGEALSGDYGVLQSFVVTVENPLRTPQPIAIYENPRGGHATGTYLIDGVLVQSHQTPPYSR
ncbi:MAG: pilus assembly protein N-terminal domain-containing protein, partial [Candidatus Eremiobacteraeota bacterium]|nr:pilus assembly protein N-terminal domain-containing protein [Candidatus Eremiobacteraeota bacterium]